MNQVVCPKENTLETKINYNNNNNNIGTLMIPAGVAVPFEGGGGCGL